MCAPLPALSGQGFGARDATSPWSAATPRIVFAHEDLLVGRAKRRGVARGDLVLAVPELRVVLLEHDSLCVERLGELVEIVLRRGRADGREAQTGVDRDELTVDARRERELVLERYLESQVPLREPLLHPLEERALADRRRRAVQRDVVDEHRARVRRIGEHSERVGIGHETNLADGSHAVDRLQLVEPVHRLHGDGEPDAARDSSLEAVPRARLGADRSVVSTPDEADEAETRLVRLLHDLMRLDQHSSGDRHAAQHCEPQPPVPDGEQRRPLRAERHVRAERGREDPDHP